MITLTPDDVERIHAIAREEMYKALWDARQNNLDESLIRGKETSANSEAIDNIIITLLEGDK